MRKIILILMTLVAIPSWTAAAHKHGKKLHDKVQQLGHKKRMKAAAKPEPGSRLHHHQK